MTNSELYNLVLFNQGHNCSNCAYNTTDIVGKCNSKLISENHICKRYLHDTLLQTMKLIDKELGDNKNDTKRAD